MTHAKNLAIALLLALSSAASAAPANDASVRKLMEVMKVQAQMAGAMEQVKSVMRTQMQKGYEQAAKADGLPEDPELKALMDGFMDDIAAVIDAEMTAPEIYVDLVKAYASVYTEEEVQAQIKFYSTPVGRKVVERGPELMKVSMELMQQRMPAMQSKLMEVMKELQAKVLELKAKRLREKSEQAPQADKKP